MPKELVRPENIPAGTSWVYHLDAQGAIDQCRVFGLEPAATLTANRVLLGDFLVTLKINGGSLDPPENLYPEAFVDEEVNQSSSNSVALAEPNTETDALLPGLKAPPIKTMASSEIPTASVPTNPQSVITPMVPPPPSHPSTDPPWQQLINATAAAVGESIARALATTNLGATSRSNSDSCPRVLQDLVNRIPVTSGSDPRKFVEFLIQVEKIRQLNLADSHAFLVSLLPRTSNQLRTAWTRAVADNLPIQDLMQSLLGFFLPHRLRHSMVSDLLYRSQRLNEPLAEFISDLQDCKSLLMPSLSQAELLEIALTGINQDTRSRLAGFPAPSSVDELLALAPRIEVISRVHSAPNNVPTRCDPQPNWHQNGRYNNDRQRTGFSQNRQPSHTYQPNRFHNQSNNSQRGRGQALFHRPQLTPNQATSNSAPQSNNTSGQTNSRGGQ